MNNKSFFVASVLILITLFGVFFLGSRKVPKVMDTNLENLPLTIDNYIGVEDSFSDAVYDELNADKHIYRHYTDDQGNKLSLYIGYYGTAKGGRTGHNPYVCLPSAGWGIVESGTVEVQPSYYPNGVKVKYIVASKDGINNVMIHWYQSAGSRVLASGLQQNIERFKGRVLYNRNDGAYLQVNSYAAETEVSEVRERATSFEPFTKSDL